MSCLNAVWLETELGGQEGGRLRQRGTGWVADTGDGREMGRRDVNWGQITAVATTGTRFSVNIGSTHKATDVGKHL